MLTQQASVADDGSAVAGVSAGFGAWLTTNVSFGATGSAGGFNFTTGVVDAPTSGTERALSETTIRDILQSVYEQGGDPTIAMSTPDVIRLWSEFSFTSSARIATLTSDVQQQGSAVIATGSVNTWVTDFGIVVSMIANRLQQEVLTDNATLYFISPSFVRQGFLTGYNTMPLAKTGLSDKMQILVDYTLKVLAEEAHGAIYDIDPTLAMVA